MPQPIRPRRSMLYVPGDKPRALEKARTLPCDAIVIDLEDAVAPANKALARDAVAAAIGAGGYGRRELILRVGGVDIEDDFALARSLPLDGVLVPKVQAPETVRTAADRAPHPIWCMIETPLGVLRAEPIAAAAPGRVAGFVVGTNDLAKDLHATPDSERSQLLPALALILLAARAHGIAAIDGVHTRLEDAEGLEAACRQGLALGFDGKSLVHPATIDTANRIFGPDDAAIERARRLVAAWETARAEGRGVARIDGAMVEQLHVDDASRLLALADAIARR